MPWTPRRITAWSSTTRTRDINPPVHNDGRVWTSKFSDNRRDGACPFGGATASRLDNLISDGVADELADRVQLQLAHDVSAVRFRCLHADAQGYRDFLAALAFGQQLDNFA